MNVFAFLLIGLLATGLYYVVPWLTRRSEPPAALLRATVYSKGMDLTTQIFITNPGPRQLYVRWVMVDALNGQGEIVSFSFNEVDFKQPFTVEAGQIGTRTVSLGRGPGFIVRPVTRAMVYYFDGRMQEVVYRSTSITGNDPVIPEFVQRLRQEKINNRKESRKRWFLQ